MNFEIKFKNLKMFKIDFVNFVSHLAFLYKNCTKLINQFELRMLNKLNVISIFRTKSVFKLFKWITFVNDVLRTKKITFFFKL